MQLLLIVFLTIFIVAILPTLSVWYLISGFGLQVANWTTVIVYWIIVIAAYVGLSAALNS